MFSIFGHTPLEIFVLTHLIMRECMIINYYNLFLENYLNDACPFLKKIIKDKLYLDIIP